MSGPVELQTNKKLRDYYGQEPEDGDTFPLVPKTKRSPDVSHIVKEIFQDYLKDEVPSYETAKQMQVTCNLNKRLKDYADAVVKLYESHHKIVKDISTVEETMMKNHARFLLKKDVINRNKNLTNTLTVKGLPLFRPLEEHKGRKYPLIKSGDIFGDDHMGVYPPDAKVVANYLMSSQISLTGQIPSKKPRELLPPKIEGSPTKPQPSPCKRRACGLQGDPKNQQDDLNKPKQLKKKPFIGPKKDEESIAAKPLEVPCLLNVKPSNIVFTSYFIGHSYQKSVLAQNISSKKIRVQILPLNESSKFTIKDPKEGVLIVIAAGIPLLIKIGFRCFSLDNASDKLILKVEGGRDVIVPISAERFAPILEAPGPPGLGDLKQKSTSDQAGTTLECGVVLVGESVLKTIHLSNDGGNGTFWIMSEEEWTHCEIKFGTLNNILRMPPFSLRPFYFHLESMEEITLGLFYQPETQGLQIKHIKILCDNCVVQALDILGDAVYFESRFISFEGLKKNFPIEMVDDKYADYYFNMGHILPNGNAIRTFFLSNESDIEFQYRWTTREIFLEEEFCDDINNLPSEWVSIAPIEGVILPKSDQTFTLKIAMKNAEIGQYRGILSFHVEKLPWQSVIRASNVRGVAVNPEITDRVNVLVNEIEVWAECVSLVVMLQPRFIKMTGGQLRCNEQPILPKITMTNAMLEAAVLSEITISPPLEEPTSINKMHVQVTYGSINAKTFLPCPLKVTPLSYGLLLHEIRCSLNDNEKTVEMMVCAQVVEPQIYLSRYILNFQNVRKNAHATQQLKVFNGTRTEVVWIAREFRYDFNDGVFKTMRDSNLSSYGGTLGFKDSVCTVEYILNTQRAGIWVSLLEFSVASSKWRFRQHFVLVVADVQETRITVSAPPHFTAFLCPGSPLFFGIPVTTTVIVRNHTSIALQYRWGVPIGSDTHKLKLRITPRSDFIQPSKGVALNVIIIPLETGIVSSFYVPCFVENEQNPVILAVKCIIQGVHVTFVFPSDPHCLTRDQMEDDKLIPWTTKHKLVFPPSSLTDFVSVESFSFSCCEEVLAEPDKVQSVPARRPSNRVRRVSSQECLIQNIDYDTEDREHVSSSHPLYPVNAEITDVSKFVEDGRTGLLYLGDDNRLVLHLPVTKSDAVVPLNSFSASDFSESVIADNDPDWVNPPSHWFPLAEKPPPPSETSLVAGAKSSSREGDWDSGGRTDDSGGGGGGGPDVSRTTPMTPTTTTTTTTAADSEDAAAAAAVDDDEDEDGRTTARERNDADDGAGQLLHLLGDRSSATGLDDDVDGGEDSPLKEKDGKGRDEWKVENFAPNVQVVQEIVLKNIPVKQVAQTKIFIRNETPIETNYEVKVKHFPPKAFVELKDLINSSLDDLPYKERDKLEHCVQSNNGIVVLIKQNTQKLKSYQTAPVDICVYADTWGVYCETITCHVNGLPPYYIRLITEVKGLPVYFAMSPPSIVPHIPFRFGVMRFLSKTQNRSLGLYNESSIPVCISWHIFNKDEKQKLNKSDSLMIHMCSVLKKREVRYGRPQDIACKICERPNKNKHECSKKMEMNLLQDFCSEDYTCFQVRPQELIIQPKSSAFLDVSFNPVMMNGADTISLFSACLVGFIRIASNDIYKKDNFYRPYGKYLHPIVQKLTAEVEIPSLTLEIEKDNLDFCVEAGFVLSQPKKEYRIHRTIIVRNSCKSSVTAIVNTETPFFIHEVKTKENRKRKLNFFTKDDVIFTVLPGESAEIDVLCKITEKLILKTHETFNNATKGRYTIDESDKICQKTAVIERHFNITQPSIRFQTLKFKLILEFPIVTVSTEKINFGPVFVGDSKYAIMEIENRTKTCVWFNISKVYQTYEFSTQPTTGVLPPASRQNNSIMQIKVIFSPAENMSYMDYLKVHTYFPGNEKFIVLDGVGTTDSKFHKDFLIH